MPAPAPTQSLEALPNEILLGVVTHLQSTELLKIAPVSRRFYSLVTRLLHGRLLHISSLPSNELIFECFHPSAKLSTPWLNCQYIGTRVKEPSGSSAMTGELGVEPKLDSLHHLYSIFRPVVAIENRRRRLRAAEADEEVDNDVATELIDLDEGELFVQLCAVTNFVKSSTRPGLFLSHVNISDGVVRVWRDWLAEMVDRPDDLAESTDGSEILWVNAGKSIGLRFKVTTGPAERMPVMFGHDDLPPESYRLEYQELLVRTSQLLLAAEKSAQQETSHSGKAIVIASM